MKRIAVTQRVEIISSYAERRDALDQRWVSFLQSINLFPLIIPNNISYINRLIKTGNIDGVLLTGGNSLASLGGDAPERDEVEKFLIRFAYKKNLPILGVCRGMQMGQEYFNNCLSVVTGHISTRHSLTVNKGRRMSGLLNNHRNVNSFHKYGSFKIEGELLEVARSPDGVIMAVEHKEKNIYGVMWHSEREIPFKNCDQDLFKKIFFGDI